MLTAATGGAPRNGGIGFAIVDGQLNVAIADEKGCVMVGALHASVLDEFCGQLADHLTAVSPVAADAQLEAEVWPTMQ
jgi:hypothetical protein